MSDIRASACVSGALPEVTIQELHPWINTGYLIVYYNEDGDCFMKCTFCVTACYT